MNPDSESFSDAELSQAVALFYDGKTAPQVSAKGNGQEAEQIIAIAREHKVPLCENPALVQLLSKIELGDHIPQSLYVCIAQILAFAFDLQGKIPGQGEA
ncbi:MAG: EscU/YscU/HrcU family type III secretion system export apparatus switch protein [Cellvibrionaceae bacterium]|nr:EscU/YscU/HrcU family type III secretion system export apparatus switch protein [Cellvibrionaceae bacterium]MCV6627966.1 EscU/YscU/HrcU family type III secretion system export apparatus switch protein [Cellvibrionaceae bacterium]